MKVLCKVRSERRGIAALLLWLATSAWSHATVVGRAQTSVPKSQARALASKETLEAYAAAQHGDAPRALAMVETTLRAHPDFAPAFKLKGLLLEDAGDDSGAASAYREALRSSPHDVDMLLKVGTLELLNGQGEQAIALLSQRVHAVPGDKEGNYYLAQAYHLDGNNDLALDSIRKAVAAAPDEPPVLQKYGELLCSAGNNAEALQWLMKAQHMDPALPRIQFDLAVASYNNMDLHGAATHAAQQHQWEPGNLPNLSLLAAAQMKLGDWEDARTNLQEVLAVNREDATTTLSLGQCDLELKEYSAAIDALKQVLQLDPTQVQAHFLLSRAYTGVGNATEAQHEIALHREMMGHLSFAMPKAEMRQQAAISAKAQALLAGEKESEALHLFEINEKGPDFTRGSAWMAVGGTYLTMGNTQAAGRCFTRALALAPRTHGLHASMGTVALQEGNLVAAEADFSSELAIDPNYPLALGELGEIRYRQGRWVEAADLLTRSKTTIPSLLFFLAAADFQLGKTQAADLAAEAVAAYGTGEPAILEALTDLLRQNGQVALAQRLRNP